MRKKIYSLGELAKVIARERKRGRIVVTTNGVFDILHLGHIEYLQKARSLGDMLVVAVNTDSSVRRLKGPTRPINPLDVRAKTLAALECVDYVVSFSADTPVKTLAKLKPCIHVKGGDYKIADMPETPVVEANGGTVVVVPLKKGYSTTSFIARIADMAKKGIL